MKSKIQQHKKNNFRGITKNLFITIAFVSSSILFAQTIKKTAIPDIVKENFSKEFPTNKANWGIEKSNFEAEFKMNGINTSAVYDKNGHRLELEVDMKIKELQTSILDYLKKNYPTYKITEAAKITNDKNVITYEAEIKKDRKSFDVLFDSEGKFTKIVLED